MSRIVIRSVRVNGNERQPLVTSQKALTEAGTALVLEHWDCSICHIMLRVILPDTGRKWVRAGAWRH